MNQNSFKIDIAATIGPDLVVDMHNLDFWKAIPAEYFENIQDHTYGYMLFESETSQQTVQEIFRTLKPGGFLTMDHDFKEEQIMLLKDAGFSVSWGTTKMARKLAECRIS